jgi:hypothetical protein
LSPALKHLDEVATKLLASGGEESPGTGNTMPYDFETATDQKPPQVSTPPAHPRDLEAIVTLLELAAIYLTPSPGTEFTLQELMDQVRIIGGEKLAIDEKDVSIVLGKASFLKKHGQLFRMK